MWIDDERLLVANLGDDVVVMDLQGKVHMKREPYVNACWNGRDAMLVRYEGIPEGGTRWLADVFDAGLT